MISVLVVVVIVSWTQGLSLFCTKINEPSDEIILFFPDKLKLTKHIYSRTNVDDLQFVFYEV